MILVSRLQVQVKCKHTDLIKEISTGRKLEEHVNRRNEWGFRAGFHGCRCQELKNIPVLEGGVNAHLFVQCLALGLSGLCRQCHHFASSNAVILGINGLKYPMNRISFASPHICFCKKNTRGEATAPDLLNEPIAFRQR